MGSASVVSVPVPVKRGSRPLARALLFGLLAYGGAWLVCLPLWLGGRGLSWPGAPVLLIVMMATPTLAALVTAKVLPDGRRLVDVLGLRPRWRRSWRYLVLAWFAPVGLSVAAVALAAALGLLRTDLRHFSGYVDSLTARGPLPLPVGALVAVTLVQTLFAPGVNALAALGEELGWRGMLRDCLRSRPRGQVVLVTGVVWGLWHAPVVLLGYNYPGVPHLAALGAMVAFTTGLSALFEWLRGAAGTVWVTAVAHGAVNASAGLAAVVVARGARVSNVEVGLLGWTGWALMAVLVLVLVLSGRWRLSATADAEERLSGPRGRCAPAADRCRAAR